MALMQCKLTWLGVRRGRRYMLAFVALGVLGTWLLLTTAEVHEPLHRWLHGGTIPDDDDCAVVLLATGKVDVAVVTATAAPVAVAIIALVQTYVLPLVPRLALPMGRGPPRFPASRLV